MQLEKIDPIIERISALLGIRDAIKQVLTQLKEKLASFAGQDRSRNNCRSWTRKSSVLVTFSPKSCDSGYENRTLNGRTAVE